MITLALEASTSAAKAMVYSLERGVLAQVSRPYGKLAGSVVTLDSDLVVECLLEAGAEAARGFGPMIGAVALSSIWHSTLPVDAANRPLMDALTWANTGASGLTAHARKDQELTRWLYGRTGCMVHSLYPLWQFKYLLETRPRDMAAMRGLWSLGSYLTYRMTGKALSSRSFASGSGFFNIHTLDWDDEILSWAGIPRDVLPELCEADDALPILPDIAKALGIGDVPVAAGGADGALNQIGSGALTPGIMTFSVGTSGALRVATQKPVLPANPATWCYYAAENTRVAGAATSGACNCVDWFRDRMLGGRASFPELEAEIAIARPTLASSPIFLPFLFGERCPGWRDDIRGGFFGVSGNSQAGHMYYGVLEGILFNLYQCYKTLVAELGEPMELRLSGGILRSPTWTNMAADIFGRNVSVNLSEDQSVLGAVALGLKAAGALKSLRDMPPPESEIVPNNPSAHDFYQTRFERYQAQYQALIP